MEKNPIEKQEHPPRNLLTHFQETVDAIAELEGGGWLLGQERGGEQTVHTALDAIKRWEDYESEDDDGHSPLVHTIYGDGGVDRFPVRRDGTVEFSERHAGSPERLERAKALGFSIN